MLYLFENFKGLLNGLQDSIVFGLGQNFYLLIYKASGPTVIFWKVEKNSKIIFYFIHQL